MAKLAIFGATGQTGIHLVTQPLNKGHEVKALVRNPEKLTTELDTEYVKYEIKNIFYFRL